MKKLIYISTILFYLVGFTNCNNVLDLEPLDRIQGEDLFSDPEGVRLYMANLYAQLPTEDFTFFRNGFNINSGDPNNGGFVAAMLTDEAVHSEFGDFMRNEDFGWWEPAYSLVRDVNLLFDYIPSLDVTEEDRAMLLGEASFIRGYAYFGLAKRYGGVSIIAESQSYDGNIETLKVPRSTEKDTWDFIMSELATAADNLPEGWPGGERRATKWAALALQSRAALHAASIAKFGDKAPFSGDAAEQQLIGIQSNQANTYYQIVIDAAEEIILNSPHGLFRPDPSSPEEAAENIRLMFQDPNISPDEAIFIKGYALPGADRGHNYDIWFQPAQLANGWPHPGRMNPTLDLIDIYETYDNPGKIQPLVTRADGIVDDYNGYSPSISYLHFSDPNELVANRDARFHASVVAPLSEWKDKEIIIQAGYVKPDGSAVIRTKDQIEVNGQMYYTYGAPSTTQYSGFDGFGGNNTRTGFSFKKFLNQNVPVTPGWNQSTTDFMDMRYAEVLLNYAEAVLESGLGNMELAAKGLNDIRKRAGHTVEVPLTIENLIRERRVELAFENKRYWDLIRRREYEETFNNRRIHSLLPLLDLRMDNPQYIFVRTYTPNLEQRNFDPKFYYRPIPGISGNGLVQNPQY
ncbi:RagB/SusD family nutrient uptake outer membrane protein [Echinicola shivajiensis]|uniref:RagB/SusD family nutrient uptake outer membrane protein n=1 Tax=Echinicola shivajiensis TaxID=1035916 RepID=UPI001BFC8A1E|nr:RagB/SusD family nutrient uptake outer membrane protein [Echinicola shivajiensis]